MGCVYCLCFETPQLLGLLNTLTHLLIRLTAAEAEDEQVPVRVCAGKVLTISRELAVEHCSMTLTFNLRQRVTEESRKR